MERLIKLFNGFRTSAFPSGLFVQTMVLKEEYVIDFAKAWVTSNNAEEVMQRACDWCMNFIPRSELSISNNNGKKVLVMPILLFKHETLPIINELPLSFGYPVDALDALFGNPEKAVTPQEQSEFYERKVIVIFILRKSEKDIYLFRLAHPVLVHTICSAILPADTEYSFLVQSFLENTWKVEREEEEELPDLMILDGRKFINYVIRQTSKKDISVWKDRRKTHNNDPRGIRERLWYRYDGISPSPMVRRKKDSALEVAIDYGLALISWDLNKDGAKSYLIASYADIFRLRYGIVSLQQYAKDVSRGVEYAWNDPLKQGRKCLNEVIMSGCRETKPFVDMEFSYKYNEKMMETEQIDQVTEAVIQVMSMLLNGTLSYIRNQEATEQSEELEGSSSCDKEKKVSMPPDEKGTFIEREDFVILDSTRPEEKASRHIIYDGKYFFDDTLSLCIFAKLMESYLNLAVLVGVPQVVSNIMVRFVPPKHMKQVQNMGNLIHCCDLPKPDSRRPVDYHCSVIDWGVYSNQNRSLRMYDCIKQGKTEHPLLFVPHMSKSVEAMESKYRKWMITVDDDHFEHSLRIKEAILYASMLQFVPKDFADESNNIIHLTDVMSLALLTQLKNELIQKYGDNNSKKIRHIGQCNNILGSRLANKPRKHPMVPVNADNMIKRFQYRGKPSFRLITVEDPVVCKWVSCCAMARVHQWKQEAVEDAFKIKASLFRLSDNSNDYFHSFWMFPTKTKYCPIKKDSHYNSGKSAIVLLYEGSHLFRCLSSNCKFLQQESNSFNKAMRMLDAPNILDKTRSFITNTLGCIIPNYKRKKRKRSDV